MRRRKVKCSRCGKRHSQHLCPNCTPTAMKRRASKERCNKCGSVLVNGSCPKNC
ncbi:MAG: hypothetical protein ACQEP3_02470 [Patescibacteria group bacterium]